MGAGPPAKAPGPRGGLQGGFLADVVPTAEAAALAAELPKGVALLAPPRLVPPPAAAQGPTTGPKSNPGAMTMGLVACQK